VHDHGVDLRLLQPLQRLDPFLIAANQPIDIDAGDPDAVNPPRPPGATIMPTVTIAAIAINAAATRQNVSLRRIRRRSTMTSESSDIENSPEAILEGGMPSSLHSLKYLMS
jgi:hypothetical protein